MTHPKTFEALKLAEPIQRAIIARKYTEPSPIQAQAIPHLLAGRDLMGCAQTGTGKTAAFALPILHLLLQRPKPRVPRCPRAVILTPTRELATQIADNFAAYGKHVDLLHTTIFGGVGQNPQVRALSRGVDIVVATPGRLIDLGQQGYIDMSRVEIFVLDEADRMLHMGFAPDVKRIMARLPEKRQSLLFSATMPREIVEIANRLLQDPVKIEVASDAPTADRITQHVCHVDRSNKLSLLTHMVSGHPDGLVLVFSRTKHGSNKLAKQLTAAGIQADAIHGNKSQRAREKALEQFRAGKVRVLVATDIAARGIDVKGISLVINHDIPHEPESYVHRIGRTARAGAEGKAIAFCDTEERGDLNAIEKLIGIRIPVIEDHPYAIPTPDLRRSVGQAKGRAGGNGGQRRGQRRRGSFVRSDGSGDEGRGRQKEWNPDIVQKRGSRTFRV